MTRNMAVVAHPLDGAFITTESVGGADPSTRKAVFKVAFTGEDCIERVHATEDYFKALVEADRRRAPVSPAEGVETDAVGDLVEALATIRANEGWSVDDNGEWSPVPDFAGDIAYAALTQTPAANREGETDVQSRR